MIYLDFEGFINEKPSLVGYKIDGKFTQLILDDDLSLISEKTDINFMNFEESVSYTHLTLPTKRIV